MNRLFTIISTSLSAAAFVYVFFPNKRDALLTAVLTLILATFLFFIEHIIRQNGSRIFNALVFFFTRSGKGVFVERVIKYEQKSKTEWELQKRYTIKSKCRVFDELDDRFCWSSDSGLAKIVPIESGQHISRIREQDRWTVYTIKFDKGFLRGSVIETGSEVKNLIDSTNSARPFLAITIEEKTSHLKMTVKIPKEYAPKNGKFSAYSSDSLSSIIYSKDISYDIDEETFTETVTFPRKNWRYVITWEY